MKNVLRRAIVTPDKHFPLHDQPAINCLLKTIEIIKPDIYIDLGDLGEWESVSHWQWKKKKRPPLEYQIPFIEEEIKRVNACQDVIDEALDKTNCKKKYAIQGNHDDWLDRFTFENPYLDYTYDNVLNWKKRGYKYYKNDELYLKIGKLYFHHGNHYGGQYHTKNHLVKLGCNIMYGHWHDLQQISVTHVTGQKSAWSIGCLKDMTTEKNTWLGGRRHNWSHGFAIVDFFKNGYFIVHVLPIINGITSLYGTEINGNK